MTNDEKGFNPSVLNNTTRTNLFIEISYLEHPIRSTTRLKAHIAS